ncbi:hypothetical protein Taro_045055, partial [Colocasia esculenta]|nr:hypothetical protein [Colocasia esculenta]
MEPLLCVVICMRAVCRARGGHANVGSVKATGSYVASAREGGFCRDEGRSDVLEVFLACSRREDALWSGGNVEWISFFTYCAKVRESRRLPIRLPVPSRTVAGGDFLSYREAANCLLPATFEDLQESLGELSNLEVNEVFGDDDCSGEAGRAWGHRVG